MLGPETLLLLDYSPTLRRAVFVTPPHAHPRGPAGGGSASEENVEKHELRHPRRAVSAEVPRPEPETPKPFLKLLSAFREGPSIEHCQPRTFLVV